jgi:amino acid transporter
MNEPPAGTRKMGLWAAVAIAVGTMIGASIFSIFGLGAQIAGKNLPEAFVLSGVFALIVAYSYAKLSGSIVSNAGPIEYILRGIGDNVITGALAILLWLSYVVSISLFAKGFSGYFLPLFHIGVTPLALGITEAALITGFTFLSYLGSSTVGKTEVYIVAVKLLILGIFIVLGFLTIKPGNISPAVNGAAVQSTLSAAVIFFLSYMGFGLVTNASENIRDPRKTVPKAMFISIGVVMVVYIAVSLAAIGNLSIPALVQARDNALAEAARPFLGNFGFILISVGALFSVSSAINATLYAGANVAYSLARDGELPEVFERKMWHGSQEGLYITAALSMVFVLTLPLAAIAAIISSIFTIIYLFVLFSHYRLAGTVGGSRPLIVVNGIVLGAVFIGLLYYQWQHQRAAFFGTLLVLGGVVLVEYLYRRLTRRRLKTRGPADAGQPPAA